MYNYTTPTLQIGWHHQQWICLAGTYCEATGTLASFPGSSARTRAWERGYWYISWVNTVASPPLCYHCSQAFPPSSFWSAKIMLLLVQNEEHMHEMCSFDWGPLPPLSTWIDTDVIQWTRPSPSVFAYCKRSKTGQWEGLKTRLPVFSQLSIFDWHHTVQVMAIWELHTLTVINSWYKYLTCINYICTMRGQIKGAASYSILYMAAL